ncbi:adenosylmethionine--8-amino-7-oxononanoate transaminase [Nocardioides piscis]|uniref:Adenosylmethionine-8-amino-7-oxononanoate aminotransferase n=1 Tax=Nocardioides piscis TaxID=2714938 RepID=A0A6G7YJV1_9ACTN|nr:adenosylmethionine--8-amino-7-oxononanoate transaminase [Nocardioides piscis]QIK77024.1 adenosylmethionine--8-amino-7-oxononanoate transaminase [Nocardioides piscis]
MGDLLDWDRRHLWHPYTSLSATTPTRLVTGARGVRLEIDGQHAIDAMSSWWSTIHGYRHPVLDDAVRRQVADFSHVMFGGLTHEPAIRLGQQLVSLTGLPHVFFADSGSVSVEVAMKMAMQARPGRTHFLTVRGGYHGDTFDAMSVCDPDGGMHTLWSGVLPQQVFGPRPPSVGGSIEEWATTMRGLAAEHADSVAAIIVEPLLQGAGGMHPYPAECLGVLREIADAHGFVLIFDEIATGFGRTGHLFAMDAAGVEPDILCLGKALTGGYVSLAAVLCTADLADQIKPGGVLMHGPTFMANPLACAVASASIDLLLEGDWQATVNGIADRLSTGLAPARDLAGVVDVRTLGAVGVIQLDHPVDVVAATDAALAAGVWLRPFRDLIYTMPPYVCTDAEIDTICAGMLLAAEVG